MFYRKKPVVIEAWCIGDQEHRPVWSYSSKVFERDGYWVVDTLEGEMKGKSGDYLIKGVHDELYICKAEIFKETYEEA